MQSRICLMLVTVALVLVGRPPIWACDGQVRNRRSENPTWQYKIVDLARPMFEPIPEADRQDDGLRVLGFDVQGMCRRILAVLADEDQDGWELVDIMGQTGALYRRPVFPDSAEKPPRPNGRGGATTEYKLVSFGTKVFAAILMQMEADSPEERSINNIAAQAQRAKVTSLKKASGGGWEYVCLLNKSTAVFRRTVPEAARASEAEKRLPVQPTPQLAQAEMQPNGNLVVSRVALESERVTTSKEERYTIELDDEGHHTQKELVRKIPVTSFVYKAKKHSETVPIGQFWVMQDGKVLDSKRARDVLSKKRPVVFVHVRNMQDRIDPFYAQFFQRKVIIVGSKIGKPVLYGTIEFPGPTD